MHVSVGQARTRSTICDTSEADTSVADTIRTDSHATQLRARADVLDKRAAHAPQPIGDRLRANADKLRGYADTHDRTRLTLTKDAG
jgi:hypothetical protein